MQIVENGVEGIAVSQKQEQDNDSNDDEKNITTANLMLSSFSPHDTAMQKSSLLRGDGVEDEFSSQETPPHY
jgi:hypothetical protein